MAEATAEKEIRKDLTAKSFQQWRESRAKREPKSPGNHRFADGKLMKVNIKSKYLTICLYQEVLS